jgi:hypothetical protein
MTTFKMTKRGLARLRRIVRFIEQHPEHWDQGHWHCKTTHCVAGFCDMIAAGYKNIGGTFGNGGAWADDSGTTNVGKAAAYMMREAKRGRCFSDHRAAHWLGVPYGTSFRVKLFDCGTTLAELQQIARSGVIQTL